MFAWLNKFRGPAVKKIAFIDGDQGIAQSVTAYHTHLVGIETHFVKMIREGDNEPRALRYENDFNKVYLSGYTVGKEVVDKFIGAYIQKAVGDGYNHITVVSNDYDFVDIFKMAARLNPGKELTFRLIVPCGQGRIAQEQSRVNFEIVHMNQTPTDLRKMHKSLKKQWVTQNA
jgi:hypothetical protein